MAPPPAARAPAVRRSRIARLGSGVIAVGLVLLVATEGVAWLAAERFRDTIPEIDERTVTSRREAYEAVERWAGLDVGLRMRVDSELHATLLAVGDRVINDYRRESPRMGPLEWKQAHEAFTWARQITPRDASLRAKQLTAEAHVARLALGKESGSAATLAAQSVLARFRAAADADGRSFDPYLGMAVMQVYWLGDVDAAAQSIEEAVRRGYTATRRETALLADGHRQRARSARSRAGVLTGEQRERELVKAREDLERAVGFYESIVEFGRSARLLESCKTEMLQIDRLLDKYEL
jgi:hypothetical protein